MLKKTLQFMADHDVNGEKIRSVRQRIKSSLCARLSTLSLCIMNLVYMSDRLYLTMAAKHNNYIHWELLSNYASYRRDRKVCNAPCGDPRVQLMTAEQRSRYAPVAMEASKKM